MTAHSLLIIIVTYRYIILDYLKKFVSISSGMSRSSNGINGKHIMHTMRDPKRYRRQHTTLLCVKYTQ